MKNTTPLQSYDGEQLYVGIDVHKKTYVVVVRIGQTIIKKWSTAARPAELAQQLLKYFPDGTLHTIYEAGFSGFVLHRELIKQGIDSKVVHAASVEVSAHNRVKTDKRDADKLSSQLAAGRLRGIHVPTVEQEQRRMLSRTREQLVEHRAAIKNQIRMKAHQLGLIAPEERREMSHEFVAEVLERSPAQEFMLSVQVLHQIWQAIDVQLKQLVAQLQQQAQSDPNEVIYRSAPGVGRISARVLSNELGDLATFTNERQLFSYTGLTPSEHSSGEQTHRGAITKQGNRHIRGILLEIAWRAIRHDPALARFFERLHPRTGKQRAIVAVARKLIGRIRGAFRKGEPYQNDYESSLQAAA